MNKCKRFPLMFVSIMLMSVFVNPLQLWAQETSDDTGRPEAERESPIALNPATGSDIGFVYEAFLSPHQEGGEEEDTPPFVPQEFRSTTSSVDRAQRTSRGHAVLEFTQDLSRAYVYLAVENVNPNDIVMLHLHCGRPGQLGPIIIDFALAGNLDDYMADGYLSLEITNADIEAVLNHQHGNLVSQFTMGCPIVPGAPGEVVTLAGMELIARQGELYFNLHTAGQTYFGDIRGQFQLVTAF
jgi:hypothetical protein